MIVESAWVTIRHDSAMAAAYGKLPTYEASESHHTHCAQIVKQDITCAENRKKIRI